jgi:hypothetical protein
MDDLALFLTPTPEDFRCIRAILDLFAGASGLITNLDKCLISPIQCTEEEITLIQQVFPCHYLGTPLSVGRLRRSDEQKLVDAIANRIPTWKGKLLNAAGRTMLTHARYPQYRCMCPSHAPSRRGQSGRSIGVDVPSFGAA